ncbi:MAG: hypothetical protein KDK91_26170 [Gammaproteobacteria bacterium]|nr:hypothetical protein [Gammaproteobacteria bacterium]
MSSITINPGDRLPVMLERIDRARFERSTEAIAAVREDHDYELRLSLKNRLIASPRAGGEVIEARMSTLRPDHVYTIVTAKRTLDCYRKVTRDGRLHRNGHHELELRESGTDRGRVFTFGNRGCVFTNKEPCQRLTVLRLDGQEYIQYQADTGKSWLWANVYTVTLDSDGQPVAIIVSAPSWLLSVRRMRVLGTPSPTLIGLMMAADHGFIFRS